MRTVILNAIAFFAGCVVGQFAFFRTFDSYDNHDTIAPLIIATLIAFFAFLGTFTLMLLICKKLLKPKES
jgi:hypothetical protein